MSRRGRDRKVVGFTRTYAFSTNHHKRCEFESNSGDVYLIQHYVINLSVTYGFSPGSPVSCTNKTDHADITEILLKVALNIINQPDYFIN